jgi:hypothetical protein
VSIAGDLNSDGYADLVVGAYAYDNPAADEGNAFVYYGSTIGPSATPSVTLQNPTNQATGYLGWAVAIFGDANGNGFGEIIAGAYGQDNGAMDEGNAFVYHGTATFVATTPSTTLDNPANQATGYFGFGVMR